MPLQSGTRLGPYEIVSLVGVGGMGEVYRAIDTSLKRAVAIKVLPESVAGDSDRLARFQREAEVLAALNHPNIAHIYGLEGQVGHAGPLGQTGIVALVMELVEGPTLEERLAAGPIALHDALPIARQVTDALAAAHQRGIVHRDLKPANVKVREDGTVKVLDFGLAKAMEQVPGSGFQVHGSAGLTNSPTLASPAMTAVGMILGTAAYMSPEQARGKPADQRSDIWAFGCVLFEMLSGRKVFDTGETVSDAVAAILTHDPDWTVLPPGLPPSLRILLRRCLQRDPERRLHHIADARLDLDDAINKPAELPANAVGQGHPSTSPQGIQGIFMRALPWAVTALALGVGAAGLWTPWRWAAAGTPEASAVRRLELNLPAGVELFATTSRAVALSPDGARLAFIGVVGGSRQIYIRPLDQFDAVPLRGSDTATECLFSPDGKSIGLLTAAGVLKAISLADGQVTTVIDDVDLERGAAWSADDSLVFGRGGTLWRIPRSGGAAKQLTTLGGPRHDTFHEWPSVLPDGKTILFAANSGDQSRIESVNLATGERQVIVERGTYPLFTASGRLVFFRDGELLAAPFDPIHLKVTGPSVQVLSNVVFTSGAPVMDVSASGVLVYAPTTAVARLVWVSRQGAEQPANDVPRSYATPRLAIDGNRVLVQAGDLWIQDLARATFTRLTSNDVSRAGFPIWTPDGRRVVYRAPAGLRVQDADGSGQGQLIAGTNELDYPGSITPDGETLLFLRSSQETSYDILSLPLRGPANLTTIVKTPAYEGGARLSPDGRWLAYVSNESGQYETYLRPFPGPERRWQISTQGGTQIVWNPNGKEIFYRNGNKMMAVDVSTAPEVALSAPRLLFEQRYAYGTGITIANYDVSRDGQRFIMVKDELSAGRLNIVLNLFSDPSRLPHP